MKLIKLGGPLTKAVIYQGLALIVPDDTQYMATDSDGTVCAYTDRPELWGNYMD